MNNHRAGCWLRNGGPQCTCPNRTPAVSTGRFQTSVPNKSGVPKVMKEFKRGETTMLNKLLNFDPRGGLLLEDAMILAAFGRQLAAEYELQKVDKPQNFDEKLEDVRRFIADTQRAERKAKLAQLKARRTQFLSATEKRELLDKEIAELEALAQ